MRRILFAASLLLLLSVAAMAQETPRVELFGGYSYAGGNFHGWNASVTGNLNRWFGVTADFSGYNGVSREPNFEEKQSVQTYMFGPKFSVRRKRVTTFAYALFGGARINSRATVFGQRFFASDTGSSLALGGGLDVRLNDRIAIRAFQIDYLRTNLFGEANNRGRLSFGVVFRFGKK
jgi:opacity protein-like surface antigen